MSDVTEIPGAAPGWTRLVVKSKLGMGLDLNVSDLQGNPVMVVDGKMGTSPKAEVQDPTGQVLYHLKGKFMGIPKKLEITDPGGAAVASLTAKMFSPLKSQMTLDLANGGTWSIEGSLMERNYSVTADGEPVVQVNQKLLAVRDTYAVDYRSELDPALVMAVIWAISRFVEKT